MKEQIFLKLQEIISANNKIPVEQVTMDSSFEDLNMDSLDGITVLNDLETAYKVSLPNELVTQMHSVRQVVEGLEDFLSSSENNKDTQNLEYQRSQIPTVKQNDTEL